MVTKVELGKDESKTVFHRVGARAWGHPKGDPYMMDCGAKLLCPECKSSIEKTQHNLRRLVKSAVTLSTKTTNPH